MTTVSVYLDNDLINQIDGQLHEDQSRSNWIQQAIREKLENPDNSERINTLENQIEHLEQQTHALYEIKSNKLLGVNKTELEQLFEDN